MQRLDNLFWKQQTNYHTQNSRKKVDDYIADSFIKNMDDAKRKSLNDEMMEKKLYNI